MIQAARSTLLMLLFAPGVCAQSRLEVELQVPPAMAQGRIHVALCSGTNAFLSERGCLLRKVEAIHPVSTVVFQDLPAGDHALKAFIDLNGNGVLDTNEQGIPREPYGLSNNVVGKPGATLYDKARFVLSPGENQIRVRMRGKAPEGATP